MQNNEQDIQKAMRLAQSPAGQQLLNMLQKNNADIMNQVMKTVAKGDYTQAQQILSALLADPEAQKLLNQMGMQL